ncbi:MAG: anthranilate synthase component II [Lachnospiraceae bacterium]
MILLIDNYDSFSYNLYQLLGTFTEDIQVVRNDEINISGIHTLNPEAIVLSPGPGRPAGAGICIQVVRELAEKFPILGVCLGHQVIYEAFGGKVTYAPELMHGKTSDIRLNPKSRLFRDLSETILAARYHSLIADPETIPTELMVAAVTEAGEIMAVEHKKYPVFGVQFHPESVMTPDGGLIINNFLEVIRND